MQSHYKAIYDAAKNNDVSSLQEAIQYASIDISNVIQIPEKKLEALVISPICQLAIENNQEAVHFLLEQGASRHEAVQGYAVGGYTAQVEALLEQGAHRERAVWGYAVGGYTAPVEALLKLDDYRDVAVWGYATGGHTVQVETLLGQGVDGIKAVWGYATGGHTVQVEALLGRGVDGIEAVWGYAVGGHTVQVQTLLEKQGANRNMAVQGYAMGGHTAQVQLLLDQGANRNGAVQGYAEGGHTAQVEALLAQGANRDMAVRGYADGGHLASIDLLLKVDLFKEINKLEVHGRSLQNQGSPQKGQKAMLLAGEIREEIYQFLSGHQEKEAASNKISKMITDGKRAMGECRNTKDIIAHIVFALTGIGLIIILGKKFLTASKSGFLNATKRQEITNNIAKETKKIFQP